MVDDVLLSAVADSFELLQDYDPDFLAGTFYPEDGDPVTDINLRIIRNWIPDEMTGTIIQAKTESIGIEYQIADTRRIVREGEKFLISGNYYSATADYEANDRSTAIVRVKTE